MLTSKKRLPRHRINRVSPVARRRLTAGLEKLEDRRLLAVVASDGFETANFQGGTGDWSGSWQTSGSPYVTTSRSPQSGSYHSLVQGSEDIQRAVNISGLTDLRLNFGAKLRSFESRDFAQVDVRIDGGSWTTLKQFVNGEDNDQYQTYDFAIAGQGNTLDVRFDGLMTSTRSDYWYIDNVQITGVPSGPPDISILDATIQEQSFPEELVTSTSGGLSNANGIAIGDDGLLYVVSRNNDSVLRYDAQTGDFVDTFVSVQSGGLDNPIDLSFGPDENLYVGSANTDQILRFDGTSGAFIDAFVSAGSAGLDVPRDLSFEDGFLYVSSGATNQVLRYDANDGSFDGVFVGDDPATTGVDESGGLDSPTGFSFDSDGNFYLSSLHSNQILQYDSGGTFLGEFVTAGAGGLDGPVATTFGPDGDFYVASVRSDQVLRFHGTTGVLVNEVIGMSENVVRPRSIVFDGAGNLLVASQTTSNVARLADSVATVELSRPSSSPITVDFTTTSGTAVAGDDFVPLTGSVTLQPGETSLQITLAAINDTEIEPDQVFTLTISNATGGGVIVDETATITIADDDAIREISIDDVAEVEGDNSLHFRGALVGADRPRGMFVDDSGVLYVTSDHSDEVLRYDPNGDLLGAFVTAGSGDLDRPFDVVSGPGGDLYVSSESQDRVLRYDGTTGLFEEEFVSAGDGGLDTANGIVFGPDGNLYVASGSTDEVLRYNGATGDFMNAFVTAGNGGLDSPKYLRFGPDGNLYVSGFSSDNVIRYNGSTGALIGDFVSANSGGLNEAEDIRFGPDGNFYVVSYGTDEVLSYDGTSGNFLNVHVPSGSGDIDGPHGMAFDADGNLYVSSTFTDEVARFGTQNEAIFEVTLSTPSDLPVTVDYTSVTTGSDSAAADIDYLSVSGQIEFEPGSSKQLIVVPIVADAESESNETFTISLSTAVGGVIVDADATGTILDDNGISYPDFSNSAGLNLSGSSAISDSDRLRLTPAVAGRNGSAWYVAKQLVATDWETTFDFNLNENVGDFGGSDGFTFAIQNHAADYLAGGGGTLGYDQLSNSLVVEFDTFQNSESGDPSASHISVHTNGTLPNSWDEALSLGSYDTPTLLDDAVTHTAKVSYVDGTLNVFLDDLSAPIISVAVDLASLLTLDEGKAWVGFTSATGGGYQNHDILNWNYALLNDAPVNQTPSADAGVDQTISDNDGTGVEAVTLVGSASDTDGTVDSVQWSDSTGVLGTSHTLSTMLPVGVHSLTFTATDNEGASASDSVVVTVVANQLPTAQAGSDLTVSDNDDTGGETVTLVGSGSDVDGSIDSYVWMEGTTEIGNTAGISPTLSVGTHTLALTVTDNGGSTATDFVTITVEPAPSGPNLAHGAIPAVGSSWQTVTLDSSYTSMVVVATPRYNTGSGPGVVRVDNVTANSFDVRVDGVGSSAFDGGVHYIAIEEGVYDEPGFKLEAVKYDEAQTSRKNGWGIDTVGYQQSYNSPVVVGQVMSANDDDWSVFWASSNSLTDPPSPSQLNVGKHVAEDPETTRATETVGYLVIEATQNGTIEGLPFVAGVGGDSVRGVGNGTYQYSYDAMPNAKTAVLSSAGMDGGDGGWAVLRGNDPVPATSGTISLSIDEDQLGDPERNHTTEQVAYFVIDPPVQQVARREQALQIALPPVRKSRYADEMDKANVDAVITTLVNARPKVIQNFGFREKVVRSEQEVEPDPRRSTADIRAEDLALLDLTELNAID